MFLINIFCSQQTQLEYFKIFNLNKHFAISGNKVLNKLKAIITENIFYDYFLNISTAVFHFIVEIKITSIFSILKLENMCNTF